MFNKLINNKKFLIIIGILLFVGIFVAVIITFSNPSREEAIDETTDSSDAINDLDLEMEIFSKNPLFSLLPIESDSPFYIIDSYYKVENKTFVPALEITYKTDAGKSAAETRLKSSELSEYNPEQYEIIYTKLEEEN